MKPKSKSYNYKRYGIRINWQSEWRCTTGQPEGFEVQHEIELIVTNPNSEGGGIIHQSFDDPNHTDISYAYADATEMIDNILSRQE